MIYDICLCIYTYLYMYVWICKKNICMYRYVIYIYISILILFNLTLASCEHILLSQKIGTPFHPMLENLGWPLFLDQPKIAYSNPKLIETYGKITLLRVITTMTFIHFLTGKSSGIYSDIFSGILSGISSGISI